MDFVNGAFLACLYPSKRSEHSESQPITRALGLSEVEGLEIRGLLYRQVPVDEALLTQIAMALNVPLSELLRFRGDSLRSFYSEAVRSGAILRAGGPTQIESTAEAPMAFQSVFAGVLLAAGLSIHAANLRSAPLPTVTTLDLLKPFPRRFNQPRAKRQPNAAEARCIWQDEAYSKQYRAKYGPREHSASTS